MESKAIIYCGLSRLWKSFFVIAIVVAGLDNELNCMVINPTDSKRAPNTIPLNSTICSKMLNYPSFSIFWLGSSQQGIFDQKLRADA